jgi:hypothetical protein
MVNVDVTLFRHRNKRTGGMTLTAELSAYPDGAFGKGPQQESVEQDAASWIRLTQRGIGFP